MSRGYVLDTNVLSATSPDRRPEPAKARARRWIEDHAEHVWLPMVAVGEIASGIGKREAVGATRHAAELADWLSRVLAYYPGRIMPFGLQGPCSFVSLRGRLAAAVLRLALRT